MSAIRKTQVFVRVTDILRMYERVCNCSFYLQISKMVPTVKYTGTSRTLSNHPSAVVRCQRIAMEIKALLTSVVKSKLHMENSLIASWNVVLRLVNIYLKVFSEPTSETPDTVSLTKEFDAELSKWNDSQIRMKKSFSALFPIIGKLATTSVYMNEPLRSTVLKSSADAAAARKLLPEFWKLLAKLEELIVYCQAEIRSENEKKITARVNRSF